MGCRCSKPDLDAFEREERLLLEHAAQSEKLRVHIQTYVETYWSISQGKKTEVGFEDHCKVYRGLVPRLSQTKWQP
eukprot:1358534-Amorphochlora_amoeboformis.AAC.2